MIGSIRSLVFSGLLLLFLIMCIYVGIYTLVQVWWPETIDPSGAEITCNYYFTKVGAGYQTKSTLYP